MTPSGIEPVTCGRKVESANEIERDKHDQPIDLLAHPVSYSW
jgi:hypothetical protein